MVNEDKTFFKNIKNFRNLLVESVSENDIKKYIENHEFIYIYYAGDEKNQKGYRTIRPYVLGVSRANNLVIRAWQDRGKSVSRMLNKRGLFHDYWDDNNGEQKPGWRMFRLDRIEKIYPIKRKFHDSEGNVMIPPKYKEGSDKDMKQIIAYVSTEKEPKIEPTEPAGIQKQKINKWERFNKGNKNNRKINRDDILALRNIIRDVYKERIGDFYVVINNNNEYEPVRVKDLGKIPKQAIVGDISYLYDTMVKSNITPDDKFFKTTRNKLYGDLKNKNTNVSENKNELPTIPFERKSFFKN